MNTLQRTMRSTTNDDLRSKPVAKLSGEELAARLNGTAISVIEDAWSKGDYITYFDEHLCPDERHMIHEFSNRKELVVIDKEGKSHFVKIL